MALSMTSTSNDTTLGIDLLRRMLRIRRFEERLAQLASAGEPVTGHLYIGEEAVAAGVCTALRDDDYITSTHRGHGHIIAKGGDLGRCMAELYAKRTGYCGGKGGSMHIADMALGIIGANGIVGAGLPIASGAALASKLRGHDTVSIAFFGDGAANHGTLAESLNMAAVWSLPVIFVCENNGWAELSRTESLTAGEIVARSEPYGVPGQQVDGNDALAVFEAASEAVDRAREGGGPSLIEAKTYRMREHNEALARFVALRRDGELETWRDRDPIERHRRRMIEDGAAEAELDALDCEVIAEVDAAVEFARASPSPDPEAAYTDMFADEESTS
jgi:TPP-dependent pyruvate/acetoin dehydrogenase alpha subunit